MSDEGRGNQPAAPRAVRLTFAYEGNDIRLVSQHPVDMIVPPSDALSRFEGEQGFWVEVRSGQDALLHRRVMDDPLRQDVEIFSPDPAQSVARTRVEKPSGVFTVLVPALDEADHVALMSTERRGMRQKRAPDDAEEHAVGNHHDGGGPRQDHVGHEQPGPEQRRQRAPATKPS